MVKHTLLQLVDDLEINDLGWRCKVSKQYLVRLVVFKRKKSDVGPGGWRGDKSYLLGVVVEGQLVFPRLLVAVSHLLVYF